MQGCTTTGYIGILRAAPPRKSAAEKTPSTPFPREEMAWTAMAAIHIVAHILRTNVNHLNPARRLAEPFSTAMLALYPRKLPTSCAPAHEHKHAVSRSHKECFSAESGTHKCKSAGEIPTHPSQTDLILASEIAPFTFFTCYRILF